MADTKSGLKIGVAAVLLIVAAVVAARQFKAEPAIQDGSAYFYDLVNGGLFLGPATAKPPIAAPSGAGNGVRAYVYGCGQCDEASRQIGYLTTYSDEARAMMSKPIDEIDSSVIVRGTMIALPPDEKGGAIEWVVQSSPAGETIRRKPDAACADAAVECVPTR